MPIIYDPAVYQQLRDADIDHLLAQHIAHLFIRDTVSLFQENLELDDTVDTDHFEVIISTEECYKSCDLIFARNNYQPYRQFYLY